MSKLGEYLEKNKMDVRRVLATSKRIEALRPEDRALKMLRAKVKGGSATEAEKSAAAKKPRSGKAVTAPLLARALRGEAISGPAKTRVVRALNALRGGEKGGAEATIRNLF